MNGPNSDLEQRMLAGMARDGKSAMRWWCAPEANVALFSFLLHLVWEFAQVPLFAGMPSADHWAAVRVCARATVGDAVIALLAFWGVAATARSRTWVLAPTRGQCLAFLGIGILITIAMERLATEVLGRWAYGAEMPIVPILRVGLSPLPQWVVVPPLVLWIVRRQLFGMEALRRRSEGIGC